MISQLRRQISCSTRAENEIASSSHSSSDVLDYQSTQPDDVALRFSRLRTIIAALHCNILIRKDDLIRNLDYVANVIETVQQDETR